MPSVPEDIAAHAEDFSHRYSEPLDYLVSQRMLDLGIPADKIGSRDPLRGHLTFMPQERSGGGNDPTGGLTVDSGVFNSWLLGTMRGHEAWESARLRDRIDAIIVHEYEESRRGSHVEAVMHAPDTELPIPRASRRILLAMRSLER